MSHHVFATRLQLTVYILILRPGRGAEYCDQPVSLYASVCLSVCLSVCVRAHISGTGGPIGTEFCMQIPCDRGSALLWRRRATLCTSAFMDDVTFSRNGRDAGEG